MLDAPWWLLHGLLMEAALGTEAIVQLSTDHRRVAATLPLGARRRASHPDADLSLPGVARVVEEHVRELIRAR